MRVLLVTTDSLSAAISTAVGALAPRARILRDAVAREQGISTAIARIERWTA